MRACAADHRRGDSRLSRVQHSSLPREQRGTGDYLPKPLQRRRRESGTALEGSLTCALLIGGGGPSSASAATLTTSDSVSYSGVDVFNAKALNGVLEGRKRCRNRCDMRKLAITRTLRLRAGRENQDVIGTV